ncbi:MAG: PQQ-binding-like beta-propeller repeat protein [Myxococcales bacterium]|nr:PQQ-binding-like beta-propeller repeat protein [Myxococcales bacterium]
MMAKRWATMVGVVVVVGTVFGCGENDSGGTTTNDVAMVDTANTDSAADGQGNDMGADVGTDVGTTVDVADAGGDVPVADTSDMGADIGADGASPVDGGDTELADVAWMCPENQPQNGDPCSGDCGYEPNRCCNKTDDKIRCECVAGTFFCYVHYDCAAIAVCPVCGDGQCTAGETCADCEQDCGFCSCGDGVCEAPEDCNLCQSDCGCGDNGLCMADGQCCTPDCDGIECGNDGCGGSCGSCGANHICNEGGQCELSIGECGDTSGLEAGPWPMRGLCPTRIGRTSVVGSQAGKKKWEYTTGGPVYSSPVVAKDGTIIIGSDDQFVHAVTASGQKKWTVFTGAKVRSSAAIGADGTIYIGSTNGTVYAIDPEDGSQKWTFPADQPVVTSPVVGPDGTVYFGYVSTDDIDKGDSPGPLRALGKDGKVKFTSYFPGGDSVGLYGGCALGENFIYTLPTSGNLVTWTLGGASGFSYDAKNSLNQNQDNQFEPQTSVVLDNGSVVFGAGSVGIRKITTNATQEFFFPDDSDQFSSIAVLSDGSLVYGNKKGEVRVIDKFGFGQYLYKTGGPVVWSAPAVGGDDTIYIGSEDKSIYALSPKLVVKWSQPIGGKVYSSAAIGADGTIYVGSTDGKLYAFGD